ncbi:PTS sugar transporter subunit IIA [uncultured Amnibacterium sp.]|uniref:PTS sugar transporter subunit IIA n=1 Tax=uncultured Amnibacterium sp. TaxID=1631851 RepID=UPI0035CC5520
MADSVLAALLPDSSIRLDATAVDRFDAVRQCGEALVAAGAVEGWYVDAMVEREQAVSTYVGEGVAIPHGTLAGKDAVLRDALVVLRFPDGVRWQDEDVRVCVGIAATHGGHVALLSQLAELLLDPAKAQRLRAAESPADVTALLGGTGTDR